MEWNRRRIWALIFTGLVIGTVAIPAVAMVLTDSDHTQISGGVTLTAPDGPRVNVTGATNASLVDPFPNQTSVRIVTVDGNVTLVGSRTAINENTGAYAPRAKVHYSNITGTWTKVHGLNVSGSNLYINPEDKAPVNVSGDLTRIEFRGNMRIDDGTPDFVYAGQSGTTNVTVRGLSANETIVARDVDTGKGLDVATVDKNGKVTFTGMPNSEHTVSLESDNPPQLTDPRPTGNISERPDTVSVYVEDDDFTGDNVTLEWFYQGSKFNESNTTSEGRQSVNAPNFKAGQSEWSVVATDENGNQDILNVTVGLPGDLTIRNETNASEILTDPINITVKFYNGTIIYTRNTTTGSINMTGLPPGDFIVEAEANKNFYKRVVYFPNIVGNRSIYMLNKTYPAVESRFVLDDPTGQFPTDSVLIVKRPINRSNVTKWRTIYSDRFGVEGVTIDLEKDQRYQISIRAPDNRTQLIGPYRSDVNETVTVRPGNPTIPLDDYSKGWASNAEIQNQTLEFRYDDPDNTTQAVTVWVHEKGNKSNQLRSNTTFYDLGSMSGIYSLTQNESKKTWVVKFIIEFDDGRTLTTAHTVAKKPDIVPDMSDDWTLIIGVGMLLISAGIFSMLNAAVGGIVVSIEGAILWWTGFLPGATSGAAVVIALFVCVIFAIYSSNNP